MKTKPVPCQFDRDAECWAATCQQPDKECNARDEEGNPKYAKTEHKEGE